MRYRAIRLLCDGRDALRDALLRDPAQHVQERSNRKKQEKLLVHQV
jgi:hypothetical protein